MIPDRSDAAPRSAKSEAQNIEQLSEASLKGDKSASKSLADEVHSLTLQNPSYIQDVRSALKSDEAANRNLPSISLVDLGTSEHHFTSTESLQLSVGSHGEELFSDNGATGFSRFTDSGKGKIDQYNSDGSYQVTYTKTQPAADGGQQAGFTFHYSSSDTSTAQLLEVDRADGSKVNFQYSGSGQDWTSFTDSRTGYEYDRQAGGIDVMKNGKQIYQLGCDQKLSPQQQEQFALSFANLPTNIQNRLIFDKTSIFATDGNPQAGAGGIYNSSINSIQVDGTDTWIAEDLAHEASHRIDTDMSITSSQAFQAALKKDLANGLPKDWNNYSSQLVDPPQNSQYNFGEGDLYAEISAGLLGQSTLSDVPPMMMKDFPNVTAAIKQQLEQTPSVSNQPIPEPVPTPTR